MQPLITFYEDSHLYFHRGRILKSVSSWIKDYSNSFNSQYWLEYKVLQKVFPKVFEKFKGKYKGRVLLNKCRNFLNENQIFIYEKEIKILSDEWRHTNAVSTAKGTQFHWIEEHKALQEQFKVNPFTGKKFKVIDKKLKNVAYQNHSIGVNLLEELEDGFYPEFLAWHLPIRTAGQIDEPFFETIGSKRYVDIDDMKTNASKNMKKGGMNKLKGVLSHLYDNPINKYTIQINFYAWLLAQHGFEPRNLSFTHYKDYNIKNFKRFDVKYDPDLIEKMIMNHENLDQL